MAEPFVGQIMTWAFEYIPMGWAACNGTALVPQQNSMLFHAIGTTYGGDGQNTFMVPNLVGRVGVHQGQGSGLSSYALGQNGGLAAVALSMSQIAPHTHPVNCNDSISDQGSPAGNIWGPETTGQTATYTSQAPNTTLFWVGGTGTAQAHGNYQPYLTLNFCIALNGLYPPQPQQTSSPLDGGGS